MSLEYLAAAEYEMLIWAPEEYRAKKARLGENIWWKQQKAANLRARGKGWLVSSRFWKNFGKVLRVEKERAEKATLRHWWAGESTCSENSPVSWESKTHDYKEGKLHKKCQERGQENGLWCNYPIKKSPAKWTSFTDEVMSVLLVQPDSVMSTLRAWVPCVTCCRCSVLHSSLFTSRFTKQTWGRGQTQSMKWKAWRFFLKPTGIS